MSDPRHISWVSRPREVANVLAVRGAVVGLVRVLQVHVVLYAIATVRRHAALVEEDVLVAKWNWCEGGNYLRRAILLVTFSSPTERMWVSS